MLLYLNLLCYVSSLLCILSAESSLDTFASEITAARLALDFVSKTTNLHVEYAGY